MRGVEDAAILQRAAFEERIVITNDKDFGELAVRGGHPHAGILLLRLHDDRAANRVRVVERVLRQSAGLLPGRFVVATEHDLRVRPASEQG